MYLSSLLKRAPGILLLPFLGLMLIGCDKDKCGPTDLSCNTYAELSLSDSTLQFDNSIRSDSFTISNTGTKELTFELGNNESWLTISPESGVLAPDSSITIKVEVDFEQLETGDSETELLITSEDLKYSISVLATKIFSCSNSPSSYHSQNSEFRCNTTK